MHEKCKICTHRKVFIGMDTEIGLTLCMSKPYEMYADDDTNAKYGIVTWLDVSEFDSEHCSMFEKAK